jgi:hypothetical protein
LVNPNRLIQIDYTPRVDRFDVVCGGDWCASPFTSLIKSKGTQIG